MPNIKRIELTPERARRAMTLLNHDKGVTTRYILAAEEHEGLDAESVRGVRSSKVSARKDKMRWYMA